MAGFLVGLSVGVIATIAQVAIAVAIRKPPGEPVVEFPAVNVPVVKSEVRSPPMVDVPGSPAAKSLPPLDELPLVVPDHLSEKEIMAEIRKLGCFVARTDPPDSYISIAITSALPPMSSRRSIENVLAYAKKLTSPVGITWLGAKNEDLALLREVTMITRLDLQGARITDDGLVHLSQLSRLEGLDLSRSPVTDAGLLHLRGLKALRGLQLSETKVTQKGMAALKKELPRLQIPGS
jgi:hypothetical protein